MSPAESIETYQRRSTAQAVQAPRSTADRNFRFYDNRQKYLTFVNTCSEKWVAAERVARELEKLTPAPPAVRLFDAGVGDGTVLARVMRAMHYRYRRMPFYIVGKEISLEDVRLTLDKMPDRFFEHPETVLCLTNMAYADAPWLRPSNPEAARAMIWKVALLQGRTTVEFERQILSLQSFLSKVWRTKAGKPGTIVPEQAVVLILYRQDCAFMLDHIIPKQGAAGLANFDLVLACQPYRLRAAVEFKARRILAPLTRSLRKGGRLLGIHSAGNDPGYEIIHKLWPDEDPFSMSRHTLLEATKLVLGETAREFHFDPLLAEEAIFRYQMHTLPNELENEGLTIGTSTLFSAWTAANYVAQIEEEKLLEVMENGKYLEATRTVLRKYGELWFNNESYVISKS